MPPKLQSPEKKFAARGKDAADALAAQVLRSNKFNCYTPQERVVEGKVSTESVRVAAPVCIFL
jgi:hypothetical protein